jgi:hypothetical protein
MKEYAELVSIAMGKEGEIDDEALAVAETIMPAVQMLKDGGMEIEAAVEQAYDMFIAMV